MSKYTIKPMPPGEVNTYPLESRESKVQAKDFAKPFTPASDFGGFLDSFPDILAGKEFKDFIRILNKARDEGRAILLGLGAHVIKVGLNPVLIDMMKGGWITALAMNGACIVHDFEIALAGRTSEDVEAQLRDGRFGMAEEPGRELNAAIKAAGEDVGLGEIVGSRIASSGYPHRDLSLLATAYDLNIPVSVHVAIGTDIIHLHPDLDAEALGRTALRDFHLFCAFVGQLNGGGVYLNIGSAVILPEVFLKALSAVRNRGIPVEGFSTAVFDFNRHYRPEQNVVKRPVGAGGRGYYFLGHHEIMIPLLAAALKS